jgi:acyl carrier protein
MDAIATVARRHAPDEARELLSHPDVPLADAGYESLIIVAFLLDLEESFHISFPAELIVPETFHSIRTVADAVAGLVATRRPTGAEPSPG